MKVVKMTTSVATIIKIMVFALLYSFMVIFADIHIFSSQGSIL